MILAFPATVLLISKTRRQEVMIMLSSVPNILPRVWGQSYKFQMCIKKTNYLLALP